MIKTKNPNDYWSTRFFRRRGWVHVAAPGSKGWSARGTTFCIPPVRTTRRRAPSR